MTVLYKYMKREYANLLLTRGELRIGALYEYRDKEKHGAVIGDDSEGKKTTYMEIGSETWVPETQPEFTRDFFKQEGSFHIKNIILEKPQESSNLYLFCATETFDPNALRDFDDYDTCIRIENAEGFFKAISGMIRHKAKWLGVFPCKYISRRVNHDQDIGFHPALIKDPSYVNQKEVRALWTPRKGKVSPFTIRCQKAAKYCHLHE